MTSFKPAYGNSSWPLQPVRVTRNAQGFHRVALLDMAREIAAIAEKLDADTFVGTNQPINLKEELIRYERELLCGAILLSKGHLTRASKLLGVKLTTLSEKVKRLEIDIKGLTPPCP